MSSVPTEDRLGELLLRWDELRRQGRDVSAGELCADCPELAAELRRRIEVVRGLEPVLDVEPTRSVATPGAGDPDGSGPHRRPPDGRPAAAVYRPQRYHSRGGLEGSPESVGKYRIVRRFAERSGQAAAYLAFDTDLQRHVVLKRYHDGRDGAADEAEEGRALAKVASPYVARCYGIERVGGAAYLVVEYVPGRNLAEVRRDGPPEVAHLVRILAQVADGVAAVHARGLIHRDIKPANVILHDDGSPRLVDFGLAAHLGSRRLRQLCGSAPYMAPEQARGEWDRIDQRTDIYGLGALLYTLLTGCPPHAGPSAEAALMQAREGVITPPRQLDPTIPVPLEAVCLKALARDPAQRYRSVEDFQRALRSYLRRRRVALGLVIAALLVSVPALARALRPAPARPVPRITAFEVTHYRGDPPTYLGTIGLLPQTILRDDDTRILARLDRPAYCYLLALNPDGRVTLCSPEDAGTVPLPATEIGYPRAADGYYGLTDGVGLQAFVLIASRDPLPAFSAWRPAAAIPWTRAPAAGTWRYDGRWYEPLDPARRGPRSRSGPPAPFKAACAYLERLPGIDAVHAVAFPVSPADPGEDAADSAP
jgi:serine/threonine protein kinase